MSAPFRADNGGTRRSFQTVALAAQWIRKTARRGETYDVVNIETGERFRVWVDPHGGWVNISRFVLA